MKATVVEISGYAGAFMSLYMTGKNVDDKRLKDILYKIEECTDRQGFYPSDPDYYINREELFESFDSYMNKIIKYGISNEHETILDFIKITIFIEDLHRGAVDDYDSHAKRMDIIRSSTRANKKSSGKDADISDWYKDKILTFQDLDLLSNGSVFEKTLEIDDSIWTKTPWGYIRKDLANDPDVLRGLVPLSLACDNVSTISFRNLRHVYDLRRLGTHASPELQEAMEQVRNELRKKCPILGDMLGKVWVPSTGEFKEKNETEVAHQSLMVSAFAQEVMYLAEARDIKLTREQAKDIARKFINADWIWDEINECLDTFIGDIEEIEGQEDED